MFITYLDPSRTLFSRNPQTHSFLKVFFIYKIFLKLFGGHIEPNCQKLCICSENCDFCPFGPLYLPNILFLSPKLRLLKAPLNSSKSNIFKHNICSYIPAYINIMSLSPQLCLLIFKAFLKN